MDFVSINGVPVPGSAPPTCYVCSSPERAKVERLIYEGKTHRSIVQSTPEADLTALDISEHYRDGHMPRHLGRI